MDLFEIHLGHGSIHVLDDCCHTSRHLFPFPRSNPAVSIPWPATATERERGCEPTCRMVTAVSTLLATASILLLSLSRFKLSFFFRIAFEA